VKKKTLGLSFILILVSSHVLSQDSVFLKVHFLYGSKPKREFRDSERKWFGGILGGHVGLESDGDRIVNFLKRGKVHWFASRKNKSSRFATHSMHSFYSMFRYPADSVKKAIVCIPVSLRQKQKLDSLMSAYIANTPYDYAFFGMRCGAATYDLLAQIGVLKPYGYRRTYMKIFYPRKLRKRLLRKAEEYRWQIIRSEGSMTRKWERDVR
jgi:hypothetical protein